MTSKPISRAKWDALHDIARGGLYVGRDPGRPWQGAGYSTTTLTGLHQRGLITRGPNQPGKGRLLTITQDGRDLLAGSEPASNHKE